MFNVCVSSDLELSMFFFNGDKNICPTFCVSHHPISPCFVSNHESAPLLCPTQRWVLPLLSTIGLKSLRRNAQIQHYLKGESFILIFYRSYGGQMSPVLKSFGDRNWLCFLQKTFFNSTPPGRWWPYPAPPSVTSLWSWAIDQATVVREGVSSVTLRGSLKPECRLYFPCFSVLCPLGSVTMAPPSACVAE